MNISATEKLRNDEVKAQGLANIINDDWPIIGEIAKKGFVVKTKKSQINIEEASSRIQNNSVQEDTDIQIQNQKDENLIEHVREEVLAVEKIEPLQTQIIEEQIINSKNNFNTNVNKVPKNEISRTERITLAKQIGVGLAHLFVVNATNLLKPINFVAQNFSKFFITLVHVLVPLAMALFLTQKVDFITSQLVKETAIMNLVYFAVFYTACVFMWIFTQVLSVGIFTMIKRSLHDVAKVGKEKI